MKKIKIVFLGILMVMLFCVPVLADEVYTISVSGDAIVREAPDQAVVNVSVVTEGTELEKVLEENNEKTQKLINNLKDNQIKDENIKTNFSISPRYNYDKKDYPRIGGYQVTNQVTFTTTNIKQLGNLLNSVVESGANDVGGIYFDKADKSELANLALTEAIFNAKNKAVVIANALGIRVGSVVDVQESVYAPTTRSNTASIQDMGEGFSSVPISEGTISVNASVTITYEIIQ